LKRNGGKMKRTVVCGEKRLHFEVSNDSLAWELWPEETEPLANEETAVREAINNPIGSERLGELVSAGMKVIILVDDFTRPTPRRTILRILLDELNDAGVPDNDITVMIALGTHRYMMEEEIRECVGEENYGRVRAINHEWMDEDNLVDLGHTESGTPIKVNKLAYESDFLIGVGSIVPHCFAGFSGGAKIIQPGISGPETTAATHFLVCQDDDRVLHLAGTIQNRPMDEMRQVARKTGLRFIVNVVLNAHKKLVKVVAGDMVAAHNAGMKHSKDIFIKELQEKVDIVIMEAQPADADMWQATKPLSYARRTIDEGGSIIFVSSTPDGVGNHPFLSERGRSTYAELKGMMLCDQVDDRVAGSILLVIKKATGDVDTYVVSDGLTREAKESMGLIHADSVQDALEEALKKHGDKARVGIIHHGGDVLPVPPEMR
jgi:nickel-dependent lactate racemase